MQPNNGDGMWMFGLMIRQKLLRRIISLKHLEIREMLENKLTELPLVIKEALACHEGLRRLGFKADDIYIILTEGWLLVSLRAQEKEFNIELGEIDIKEEIFPGFWGQVVERYNSG